MKLARFALNPIYGWNWHVWNCIGIYGPKSACSELNSNLWAQTCIFLPCVETIWIYSSLSITGTRILPVGLHHFKSIQHGPSAFYTSKPSTWVNVTAVQTQVRVGIRGYPVGDDWNARSWNPSKPSLNMAAYSSHPLTSWSSRETQGTPILDSHCCTGSHKSENITIVT